MYAKLLQLRFVKTEKENQYMSIGWKQQFFIDIDTTIPLFATVWIPWGDGFAKIFATSNPDKLETLLHKYNIDPGLIYKSNRGFYSEYSIEQLPGYLQQPPYITI